MKLVGQYGKFLLLAGLWLALVISALAVVNTTQRSRVLTAQLGDAQRQRDELRFEQERLLLEFSAWSAYNRIEQVAREKLDMQVPSITEQVLLQGKK